MRYCPYCGIEVHDDEIYCLKCGRKIPQDIESRMKGDYKFKRIWFVPVGILAFFICISIGYSVFLNHKSTQAEQAYEQGEEKLLAEQYEQAKTLFEDAIQIKSNFKQAKIALQFVNIALNIQDDIDESNTEVQNKEFQQALTLLNDAEQELRNYNGEAATDLIDLLSVNRKQVKLELVQNELEQNPTIDDLKILLWDAESIDTDEAQEITEHIRDQIIDYTYSKAVEQLNKHQFSDAQILVDDGLNYATNSEKLLSLQTTIEKEQEGFETAQEERIEQAINMAEEEHEVNEMDAVEVEQAEVTKSDQDMITIEGEVKSVATVPINSVLVEYSLLDNEENELVTNNVFIFPDTLYPEEIGKFEFTHYEIDEKFKNVDIQINKITWYTEQITQ